MSNVYERASLDVLAIFKAGIRAVQPDRLLTRFDLESFVGADPFSFGRIVVAGMGKASLAMASVIEQLLGPACIADGLVVVPYGYVQSLPEVYPGLTRIQVMEAGHPVPDENSIRAAVRIRALLSACTDDDLVILLVSGGGSALCTAFPDPIRLDEVRVLVDQLLKSGADIAEMNTVRKHLSLVGGGRLAEAAYPALVRALVISDVIGDDVSVIASGPVSPDATTFQEAFEVLKRHRIWDLLPGSLHDHFSRGLDGNTAETPDRNDPVFSRVKTTLLATNRTALEAAAHEAGARGYAVVVNPDPVSGEAREVGKYLVHSVCSLQDDRSVCWLQGGETTVTVTGNGKGGRNQELTLAAGIELQTCPLPAVFLSGGTDGRDGPTDAAGAWVTNQTIPMAMKKGLDPHIFIERNDSCTFFEAIDQQVVTGPTHTNVMDLQVVLLQPNPF